MLLTLLAFPGVSSAAFSPLETFPDADADIRWGTEDALGRVWLVGPSSVYLSEGFGFRPILPPADDSATVGLANRDAGVALLKASGALWLSEGDAWRRLATVDGPLGCIFGGHPSNFLVCTRTGLISISESEERTVGGGIVTDIIGEWPGGLGVVQGGEIGTLDLITGRFTPAEVPVVNPDLVGGHPERGLWWVSNGWLFTRGPSGSRRWPFQNNGLQGHILGLEGGARALIPSLNGLYFVNGQDGPREVLPGFVHGVLQVRTGDILVYTQGMKRYVPEDVLYVDERFRGILVRSLRKDGQGALWLGSQTGLYRQEAAGWERSSCPGDRHVYLAEPSPAGVIISDTHHVWLQLGAECGELMLDGHSVDGVFAATALDSAHVWLGTLAGLIIARREGHRLTTLHRHDLGSVPDLVVTDHGVFAATTRGLARISLDGSVYTLLNSNPHTNQQPIDLMRRPSAEWCWVYGATPEVECTATDESGSSRTRRTQSPVSSFVYGLTHCRGETWLATHDGLVGLESGHRVSVRHGLPSSNINRNGLLCNDDDSMWVGTVLGLARVKPWANIFAPPREIVEITRIRDHEGPLRPPFVVPGGETVTLELRVPNHTTLVGVEARTSNEAWRPLNSSTLSLVAPWGQNLTVELRARGGPVSRVEIEGRAPWWSRPTGLALGASLAAAFGLLLHSVRLRVLRRRAAQLEAALEARSREVRALESDLRRSERQAAEARLALGVAHELRNALSGAGMLIARLRTGALEPGRHEKMLGTLAAAVERSLGLTRSVLMYGRLGATQPTSTEAQLEPVLSEILQGLPDPSLIHLRLTPGLQVAGSPAELRSVLENIIQNALLAQSGRDGNVTIHTAAHAESGDAVIVVEDSGPGLSKEELQRATEPFFTTRPGGAGVGLGLAIVERILTLYGGRLRLENRAEGGARVTIHWPQRPRPRV